MNIDDLVSASRLVLDDSVAPYLWSNSELEVYANHSYQDALVRTGGHSNTQDMTIAVKAAQSQYEMDEEILHIIRAKLDGDTTPIKKETLYSMDSKHHGWESTTGTPRRYVDQLDRHFIRLYPIPDEDKTLNLTVRMRVDFSGQMAIPEHLHYGVVYLMCMLAYRKQDVDSLDEQKSMYFEGLSQKYFGQQKSANAQEFERDFTEKKVITNYFA